jgi:hypothetical protein
MVDHLTDEELERIREFIETPTYERTPEQLLPEQADVHEESRPD